VYDIVFLFQLGAFRIQNLQRTAVETLRISVRITPSSLFGKRHEYLVGSTNSNKEM
jgi:hypothetical protein